MGWIPSQLVIDATLDGTTTTANTGSIWLGPDMIAGISLHAEWNADTGTSQNLVTTNVVEASNDPRARQDHPDHANANWDDISADIASSTDIDASSGAGDGSNNIANIRYGFVKVTVTRGSGDGDYKLYFSGTSD